MPNVNLFWTFSPNREIFDIDIPFNYPIEPLEFYLDQDIYHLNVQQNAHPNNRVMVRELQKQNWLQDMSIFQALSQVLITFKRPDTSELFFESNKDIYDLYKENPGYYN